MSEQMNGIQEDEPKFFLFETQEKESRFPLVDKSQQRKWYNKLKQDNRQRVHALISIQ